MLVNSCRSYVVPAEKIKKKGQVGIASWYGSDFHGRKTANGEIYNMYGISAAHRTLSFGTYVRVTRLDNGKKLKVRINDRGPFVRGRIIDLSYGAAMELDMVLDGVTKVKIEVIERKKRAVTRKKKVVKTSSTKILEEGIPTYTIQVGAFTERENALKLKEKLDKKYSDVYIMTWEDNLSKYYRVRIGHFPTEGSAFTLGNELEKENYPYFITSEH